MVSCIVVDFDMFFTVDFKRKHCLQSGHRTSTRTKSTCTRYESYS